MVMCASQFRFLRRKRNLHLLKLSTAYLLQSPFSDVVRARKFRASQRGGTIFRHVLRIPGGQGEIRGLFKLSAAQINGLLI